MSSIKEIYQITLKSTEGTMFLPKRISAMGKVRFQLSLEIRPKKKKKKKSSVVKGHSRQRELQLHV